MQTRGLIRTLLGRNHRKTRAMVRADMDEPLTPSLLVPAHQITRVSDHHGRRPPLKVRAGLEMLEPRSPFPSSTQQQKTLQKLLDHSEKPRRIIVLLTIMKCFPKLPTKVDTICRYVQWRREKNHLCRCAALLEQKYHSLSFCKLHNTTTIINSWTALGLTCLSWLLLVSSTGTCSFAVHSRDDFFASVEYDYGLFCFRVNGIKVSYRYLSSHSTTNTNRRRWGRK
jgi:hypothetical protein